MAHVPWGNMRECNATRPPKIRVFFFNTCYYVYFSSMKCAIDSELHMLLDITGVNNTIDP